MINYLDSKFENKNNINVNIYDKEDLIFLYSFLKELDDAIIISYDNLSIVNNELYFFIKKYDKHPLIFDYYMSFKNNRIFFIKDYLYKHIEQFERIYKEKIKFIITSVPLKNNYKNIVITNNLNKINFIRQYKLDKVKYFCKV